MPTSDKDNWSSSSKFADTTLKEKIEFCTRIAVREQCESIQRRNNVIIKGIKVTENNVFEQLNEFAWDFSTEKSI